MTMLWVISLILGFTYARAGEVCCQNGCYNNNEPPYDEMPLPRCPEDLNMKFLIYSRQTINTPQIINSVDISNSIPNIDANKRTVVISHGWTGDESNWWIIGIKDAILKRFDYNFIVADWEEGAGDIWYPYSAANTRTSGAEIARFIKNLEERNFVQYDNIWCIGFSLGAHAMGHAGMQLNGSIQRITGLDPAGPWFKNAPLEVGLNPTSGKFVDVIHTDGEGIALYYGQQRSLGHSDFYPNEGNYQPGCLTRRKRSIDHSDDLEHLPPFEYNSWIACSHYRAVSYFLETIDNDDCHLVRHLCQDEWDLPDSCLELGENIQVGLKADTNEMVGKFYFETKRSAPHCSNGNY